MKANKNVVIHKGCHSRTYLSGIYNALKNTRWGSPTKTLGDDANEYTGMTPNLMGFTLIELLVVVLIIGILAAVALPQYNKAVWKARYKRLIPLISAIDRAEKVYFLAHGKYTLDFSELDVQMAAGELEGSSQSEKWYTDFMCKLRGDVENNISVSIKCYGLADGHTSNTLPYIEKYFERDYYMCTAKKNQAKAAMICRALNPFSESGGDKEIDFYF